MNKVDWWKKHKSKRSELSEMIGTSVVVMRQIVYGQRNPGPSRAIAIEAAIAELTPDDLVPRSELRPDLWSEKTEPEPEL